jgi:peptidoglycan/xylan/chitin deacetylase (PgdA/CDA1 family)
MLYFVKTPNFIKRLFQNLTWEINTSKKVIYLTFDDGPTPKITNWVLSELEKHNAKATFFLYR